MPSAVCPYCREPAFSSIEFDEPWTCPTCGETVIPNTEEARRKREARDAYVENYTHFWTRVD